MVEFFSFVGDSADPIWPEASALRQRVFVEEQGVPFVLEVDARDFSPETTHLVALDDAGAVQGVARLLHTGENEYYVGRVVVDASVRGRGIGLAIIEEAAQRVRAALPEGGCARLRLDAQVQAIDFYASCGYELTDESEFLDAGIPHRAMSKIVGCGK